MTETLAQEQHDSLLDIPAPEENPVLVGHDEARRMLAAAYRSGELPHALLLAGPAGIGPTSARGGTPPPAKNPLAYSFIAKAS